MTTEVTPQRIDFIESQLKDLWEMNRQKTKANGHQDTGIAKVETKIESLEKSMDKHLEWHEKQSTTKDNRNWQMWFLIISVIITGVGGLLVGLLK